MAVEFMPSKWCKAGIALSVVLAAWSVCIMIVVNRRVENWIEKPNPQEQLVAAQIDTSIMQLKLDVQRVAANLERVDRRLIELRNDVQQLRADLSAEVDR